jgi:hypothetical protein
MSGRQVAAGRDSTAIGTAADAAAAPNVSCSTAAAASTDMGAAPSSAATDIAPSSSSSASAAASAAAANELDVTIKAKCGIHERSCINSPAV